MYIITVYRSLTYLIQSEPDNPEIGKRLLGLKYDSK